MSDQLDLNYNEFPVPFRDVVLHFFVDNGFVNSAQYSSAVHRHDFNEIIYVKQGLAEISYQGNTLPVDGGTVIMIPSMVAHSLRSFADTVFVVISYWSELTDEMPQIHQHANSISLFSGPHLDNAFDRIVAYYNEKHTYKQELLNLCFCEIIHLLKELSDRDATSHFKSETLENNNYRKYIIAQYLQRKFNQSPSISELADMLQLSIVQSQRIIKKMYGVTFCEKILHMRMECAKALLEKSQTPISQIALKAGYNTESNFYSAFKRLYGITPKQYRKSHIRTKTASGSH